MNKPYIIGISASNRSTLSVEDEFKLTEKIKKSQTSNDYAIHDPSSDGISRSLEVYDNLLSDLEAKQLANSEIALSIALTAAKDLGSDISFSSLKNILKKYITKKKKEKLVS